jgi:hypothetical protein
MACTHFLTKSYEYRKGKKRQRHSSTTLRHEDANRNKSSIFVNFELNWGEWSASWPSRFNPPGMEHQVPAEQKFWWAPDCPKVLNKKKISFMSRESKPDYPTRSLGAIRIALFTNVKEESRNSVKTNFPVPFPNSSALLKYDYNTVTPTLLLWSSLLHSTQLVYMSCMIYKKEQLIFFLNFTNLFFFVMEMQWVLYGEKNEPSNIMLIYASESLMKTHSATDF